MMGRLLVTAVMVLIGTMPAYAGSSDAGTAGAPFLKLGISARACAMGEAGVAVDNGASTLYWNPAGLAILRTKELALTHSEWLQEIDYEYLGYAHPVTGGVWASSITYLNSGDIDGYINKDTKEVYSSYDLALSLGYGKRVKENLSLGGTLKTIFGKIKDEKSSSFAIDLGCLYLTPIEGLVIGGSLQNLGTKVKFYKESDKLPLNIKVGVSYQALEDKLLLALDLNKTIDNDLQLNLGIDYWISTLFALRAGYNSVIDEESGLTGGFGVRYQSISFDYTYVPYGDLDPKTHRFSLGFKF